MSDRIASAPGPLGTDLQALQAELAELMVATLNLDLAPTAIVADAPLYKEGLGLDSIDILELALMVSKHYGFQLRADDQDNAHIFRSLGTLTEHISLHRTR